jgi:hypothetical protein
VGEDGLFTEGRLEKRMASRHRILEQPHEARSLKTTTSLQKLFHHQQGEAPTRRNRARGARVRTTAEKGEMAASYAKDARVARRIWICRHSHLEVSIGLPSTLRYHSVKILRIKRVHTARTYTRTDHDGAACAAAVSSSGRHDVTISEASAVLPMCY